MTDSIQSPTGRRSGRRRHPLLIGKCPKTWHPEAVGVVPNYAKTLEAFQARQAHGAKVMASVKARGVPFNRKGVPDGSARRRLGVDSFKALARHEAQRIMIHLRKEGLLMEPDNVIANEALEVAIEIHRDKLADGKLRLAAARICLEWTKAKPATKIEQTVRTAESFLDDLALESLPNANAQ